MQDLLKDRKNRDNILYIISYLQHQLGKSQRLEINKL